jgi:hypothetical protein
MEQKLVQTVLFGRHNVRVLLKKSEGQNQVAKRKHYTVGVCGTTVLRKIIIVAVFNSCLAQAVRQRLLSAWVRSARTCSCVTSGEEL